MSFFNFIYRNGLWLSVPALAAASAILIYCIVSLVKLVSKSQIATLPLLEQQAVTFNQAGQVMLCLEGPRLSKRFSELSFTLAGPDGAEVPGRAVWFHTTTSGLSTVTMDLVSYTIPGPGRYVLHTGNLGAARDDDGVHRIVFARSQLPLMAGYILGIIISAGLAIGSIVLFIMRLITTGGQP